MPRRRAARYSKIWRGTDPQARTKLEEYLKGNRKVEYASRQVDRPDQKILYCGFFSEVIPATVKSRETASVPGWNLHKTLFAGRTSDVALAANDKVLDFLGVASPRVVITTGRTANGTADTSKITGKRYKRYGGTSYSIPFGPKNDTDSQGAAFEEIKNGVKSGANGARNQAVYVPSTYGA